MTTSPKDPQTILKEVVYFAISTTNADGTPWSSPVFACYDPEAKAVYWCSAQDSQHSQNIARTKQVFVAVFDSMAAPGQGWGIYLKGEAELVADEVQIMKAHAQLTTKHHTPYWGLGDIHDPSPIRLYRAQVTEAWANRARLENGFYVNDRFSITL